MRSAPAALGFRPARPEDVEAAVPLIHSSGPEVLDHMFRQHGRTAHDLLRHAFAEGSSFFGWRVHVVAELDGRVVGIGAFYAGARFDALALGTMKEVARFYRIPGCLAVFRRMLQARSIMPRPGRLTEYVADLGVAPEMRGRGVGTALLLHGLEAARTKGQTTYALDVATNNPRAQALYERFGFVVVRENPFAARSDVPDSRRMEMPVGAASVVAR